MSEEIERRFLVDETPGELTVESSQRLAQGYLAIDGAAVVRIRRDDAGWVLCVKGGSGLVRVEVERRLEPSEADQLWPLTSGRRIEKRRDRIDLGDGLIAELDTFDGDLAGVRIVEVEFDSTDRARAFEPPDWFGTELTDDARWSNAALATVGRPPGAPLHT